MNTFKKIAVPLFVIAALSGIYVQAQQPARADSAAKAPSFKTHVLTRAEFDKLAAQPEQLLVIDVRRPDELTKIGGFPVYLSIQNADIEKSISWIPKDRAIVTVSNHAARSGKAADLLASKGFKVAGTIGVQNYEEEGGTLLKIAPPAPKAATANAPVAGSPAAGSPAAGSPAAEKKS